MFQLVVMHLALSTLAYGQLAEPGIAVTPLFQEPVPIGVPFANARNQADNVLSRYGATLPEPGVVRWHILQMDTDALARLLTEARTNASRFKEAFSLTLAGDAVCEIQSVDRVSRLAGNGEFLLWAECSGENRARVFVAASADGSVSFSVSSSRSSYSFLPLEGLGFSIGVEIDNTEVAGATF